MDPLEELERMAAIASAIPTDVEPSEETIQRWIQLFKYNHMEAYHLIIAHRNDITRSPVSDSHWELVRATYEPRGYDREAYEHSLTLRDLLKSQSTIVHDKNGNRWTLFRLGGLLESAKFVKDIAGLDEIPKVTAGEGTIGYARFVWLNDVGAMRVVNWMDGQRVLRV